MYESEGKLFVTKVSSFSNSSLKIHLGQCSRLKVRGTKVIMIKGIVHISGPLYISGCVRYISTGVYLVQLITWHLEPLRHTKRCITSQPIVTQGHGEHNPGKIVNKGMHSRKERSVYILSWESIDNM